MSATDSCKRCKRAAHGGSCLNPQPMASPALADSARRMGDAATVARLHTAPPDARGMARLACAANVAQRQAARYAPSVEAREAYARAWLGDFIRAVNANEYIQARAMCLDLDPVERAT